MNQITLINHKTLAFTLPLALSFILASTFVFSLREVRLEIGDYYFNQGKYDQAVNWYVRVLRKDRFENINDTPTFRRFAVACLNSASNHLNQGQEYFFINTNLAEAELRKVLLTYMIFCRNVNGGIIKHRLNHRIPVLVNDLFCTVMMACTNLVEIYKLNPPRKILDLYWEFLDLQKFSKDILHPEKWSTVLSSFSGLNLLRNPYLTDLNNDGIPDGFFLNRAGPEATYPNKETIKCNGYNVYHVWQENGKGWFATYFDIGRVPPNMFFTFAIDIKRIDTKGKVHAMLFTVRESDSNWGSGNSFSELGLVKRLEDGWEREFHTIRTNAYSDVLLGGWIVAWASGDAGGHVYVRKPKVEIGSKPTLWSDNLNY